MYVLCSKQSNSLGLCFSSDNVYDQDLTDSDGAGYQFPQKSRG